MKIEINDEAKLKDIIKEAIRDVLDEEITKIRLLVIPYVSDEEQREIEENYSEPSKEIARTFILKE